MSCFYGTLFAPVSAQWPANVKRIRSKKLPLTAAAVQLADVTLKLEFTANAGIHPVSARRPAQSRPSCRGQLDLPAGW